MTARAEREVDPVRRRHQLAAAADAVGHRRSRGAARPRHRGQGGAAGRRQEPAGPHLRERRLRAQGAEARSTRRCGSTASSRDLAEAHFRRHRHRDRAADRDDGVPEDAAGRDAARHPAPVRRRADDGDAVSAAVHAGPMRTALPAASWCCGRRAAATSRSPRADPRAAPRIRQNFLATDDDWKTCATACGWCATSCRQPPLAPFVAREIAPGANAVDDADLDAHIRATGITVHHPLGTCRMGRAIGPHGGGRSASCACGASTACASSTPR